MPSPPQFRVMRVLRQKFRFVGAITGKLSITANNVLNLLSMATTSSAAYRLYAAAKLRKVSIWAAPNGNNYSSVAVEFPNVAGSLGGPAVVVSDTQLGQAKGCVVTAVPPKNSAAGVWFGSGTDALFQLSGQSSQVVVDLDVDFSLQVDQGPVANSDTGLSTLTAGTIYANYLDGYASGLLAPVLGGDGSWPVLA
jgi:hypothetical protein